MAEKKTAAKGYQKFKADLAAGTLGEVYIFCGEESYLREYYLKEVQKKLVPAGFEEFNFHRVAGKGLTGALAGLVGIGHLVLNPDKSDAADSDFRRRVAGEYRLLS